MKKSKHLQFYIVFCLVFLSITVLSVKARDTPGYKILAIKGTLIDGKGTAPVPDGVVLVKNNRIVAVGPEKKIKIPENAHVISIPGAFVLPGFINTHVHSRYREDLLKKWASEGVTTVRDLGGATDLKWFQLRDGFRKKPGCARIVAAGPIFTAPDGMPKAVSLEITSPEQGREKVNQIVDSGADVIKIALNPPVRPVLSKEQVKAIVQQAHKRGKPVAVHAISASAIRTAFWAGADDINHLAFSGKLSDSFVEKFAASNVYWVPTLATMPPKFRAKGIDAFKKFVRMGGKVAMGNDSGWLPNVLVGMPMRELEQMKIAGMSPMDIIKASTLNAAIVCRIEKRLGTLEKGKIADILIIKGNPLDNLENLKNARMVILDGRIIVEKKIKSQAK